MSAFKRENFGLLIQGVGRQLNPIADLAAAARLGQPCKSLRKDEDSYSQLNQVESYFLRSCPML